MTMEDQKDYNEEGNDVYSNAVRAGKRTYFFDVRATKKNDYYLTITESKRNYKDDGTFFYKKHKIFIYKEDFEKFSEALKDAFIKIIDLNKVENNILENKMENHFTEVNFDDLGKTDDQSV